MYVIPAQGLTIVDPDLKDRLPAEGREVPESGYWRRRIAEGSVIDGQPPKPASVSASVAPAQGNSTAAS